MITVSSPDDRADETVDTDISVEAARDLHRAAVELNRSELLWMVPVTIVLVAAAIGSVKFGSLGMVVFFAVSASVSLVRLIVDFVRLRRDTPIESWQRERRWAKQQVESAHAHSEHLQRSVQVTPVVTYLLMAATIAVTAIQFFGPGVRQSVPMAALVKPAVRAGEWWRLLSVAFLHGDLLHVVMNMGALQVFGSIIETYDRRARVPLAYVVAVVAGSLASTLASDRAAVGASGGVLGLAGFLLVSLRLRGDRVHVWVRNQILRALGATALLGIVAFFFVDNAAHVGGALAGAAVGWLSASAGGAAARGRVLDVLGWISAAIHLAAGAFTATRLLQ